MKLNDTDIKNITIGSVYDEKLDDGYHFYKCTPKQTNTWNNIHKDLGIRAKSTTGVRLDFITDSKNVEFTVSGGNFELLINGLLSQQVRTEDVDVKITQNLNGESNRVTLLFPSHSSGVLKSVSLDDNATFSPITYDKKILFLGDSITQGWESSFDSLSFAFRVSEYYHANSVINGIGGAFYSPATFDTSSFEPDIVIVAYGVNDFYHYPTMKEFEENVSEYLSMVKNAYKDKKVFVITPIWKQNESETNRMGCFLDCRNVISKHCKEQNFIEIDGFELVPHINSFYSDAVHPNAMGFSVYAQRLIEKINQYL